MRSTKPQANPHVYTAEEVKEILRVGIGVVYGLAKTTDIPVFRLGRRLRFPKERLHQWIDQQSNNE